MRLLSFSWIHSVWFLSLIYWWINLKNPSIFSKDQISPDVIIHNYNGQIVLNAFNFCWLRVWTELMWLLEPQKNPGLFCLKLSLAQKTPLFLINPNTSHFVFHIFWHNKRLCWTGSMPKILWRTSKVNLVERNFSRKKFWNFYRWINY